MRQLRVTVQRDDKPHVGKLIRVPDPDQGIGPVLSRAIDQTVEFFKLPPFTFPSDKFSLGLRPFPLPMEKEEPLTAMPAIEVFN